MYIFNRDISGPSFFQSDDGSRSEFVAIYETMHDVIYGNRRIQELMDTYDIPAPAFMEQYIRALKLGRRDHSKLARALHHNAIDFAFEHDIEIPLRGTVECRYRYTPLSEYVKSMKKSSRLYLITSNSIIKSRILDELHCSFREMDMKSIRLRGSLEKSRTEALLLKIPNEEYEDDTEKRIRKILDEDIANFYLMMDAEEYLELPDYEDLTIAERLNPLKYGVDINWH